MLQQLSRVNYADFVGIVLCACHEHSFGKVPDAYAICLVISFTVRDSCGARKLVSIDLVSEWRYRYRFIVGTSECS